MADRIVEKNGKTYLIPESISVRITDLNGGYREEVVKTCEITDFDEKWIQIQNPQQSMSCDFSFQGIPANRDAVFATRQEDK